MIEISELAKYQPASLQSGCVTVSGNLDPEDDKPCSMGGKYGKYGKYGMVSMVSMGGEGGNVAYQPPLQWVCTLVKLSNQRNWRHNVI